MNVPRELAEEHYVDLKSKPFYAGLVEYICRWAHQILRTHQAAGCKVGICPHAEHREAGKQCCYLHASLPVGAWWNGKAV